MIPNRQSTFVPIENRPRYFVTRDKEGCLIPAGKVSQCDECSEEVQLNWRYRDRFLCDCCMAIQWSGTVTQLPGSGELIQEIIRLAPEKTAPKPDPKPGKASVNPTDTDPSIRKFRDWKPSFTQSASARKKLAPEIDPAIAQRFPQSEYGWSEQRLLSFLEATQSAHTWKDLKTLGGFTGQAIAWKLIKEESVFHCWHSGEWWLSAFANKLPSAPLSLKECPSKKRIRDYNRLALHQVQEYLQQHQSVYTHQLAAHLGITEYELNRLLDWGSRLQTFRFNKPVVTYATPAGALLEYDPPPLYENIRGVILSWFYKNQEGSPLDLAYDLRLPRESVTKTIESLCSVGHLVKCPTPPKRKIRAYYHLSGLTPEWMHRESALIQESILQEIASNGGGNESEIADRLKVNFTEIRHELMHLFFQGRLRREFQKVDIEIPSGVTRVLRPLYLCIGQSIPENIEIFPLPEFLVLAQTSDWNELLEFSKRHGWTKSQVERLADNLRSDKRLLAIRNRPKAPIDY